MISTPPARTLTKRLSHLNFGGTLWPAGGLAGPWITEPCPMVTGRIGAFCGPQRWPGFGTQYWLQSGGGGV
ncbi:hypothetical protein GCM10018779_32080 [Streptomyces griseocarneus]|nr:hypothetical protein GCM10018779_32080 [Streptomyces griseocarneus]